MYSTGQPHQAHKTTRVCTLHIFTILSKIFIKIFLASNPLPHSSLCLRFPELHFIIMPFKILKI